MKSPGNHEVHALLSQWLTGTLNPAETTRLAALARQDVALRREMGSLLTVERLLRLEGCISGSKDAFAAEVIARLQDNAGVRPELAASVIQELQQSRTEDSTGSSFSRNTWKHRWLRVAAVAVLLASIAGAVYTWRSTGHAAATITGVEAAVWPAGQVPLKPGEAVRGNVVEIASGFVNVRFPSGAAVLLEGPAKLKLLGTNKARLEHGKAVAEVPNPATGFVMESPEANIIDLGTRFGMKVGLGSGTEVHVLEGKVQATLAGQNVVHDLQASQGALLGAGTAVPVVADQTLFLTQLPPLRWGPTRYVHWSFDEGQGALARSANGVPGEDLYAARLTRAMAKLEGTVPAWVPGRFGQALSFDGTGGYAVTGYKGVEGARPRTVAFWLRVPNDWEPRNGFALVSWGTHLKPGGVWQISVNPEVADGPLGRLRVGVQGAQVIGTRDLRDGQWHHAAVVLYNPQDAAPTTTQILLYLDGQLEPAERRAVRAVETQVEGTNAIPVTFGRNSDEFPQGGRMFFRGTIDEVFIVEAALSQPEIQRLLTANQLPPVENVARK